MDSATQDLYFQKMEEFVKDEDKIITCNSLVRELNISIKDAKSVISKYVEDQKHLKSPKLAVTYLVSGILKEGDLGLYWLKEENLPEKKKLFKKITVEFIYSVQKSKCIDLNAIVLANKSYKGGPLLGSVVGKNCVKRNLKVKKLPIPQSKPTTKSFFTKTSSEEKKSPKQAKAKSAGISNFFSKQTSKSEEKPKIEPKIEENRRKPKREEKEKTPKKVEEKQPEEMEIDVESSKDSKKRRKSKKNEPPNKKRRRIEDVHNSDSSDMFDSEKEEDIIEASEDEVTAAPQVKTLAPKNKRRKAVDRTYVDDEGYIVTKVEYVYETASEEEVEMSEIQKENKSKPVVEKKSNGAEMEVAQGKGKKGKKQTGKQPTLLNFFSKK